MKVVLSGITETPPIYSSSHLWHLILAPPLQHLHDFPLRLADGPERLPSLVTNDRLTGFVVKHFQELPHAPLVSHLAEAVGDLMKRD
jgi:hypothetical protein